MAINKAYLLALDLSGAAKLAGNYQRLINAFLYQTVVKSCHSRKKDMGLNVAWICVEVSINGQAVYNLVKLNALKLYSLQEFQRPAS